jgi:tRNA (guanine37-N1)-methyltransferase
MLGCIVYANDINPECFKWMNINLKKNQPKKSSREYHIFNLDGREFLQTIVLPRIENYQKEILDDTEKCRCLSENKIVILMNLPELALTFLDVFSTWLSTNNEEKEQWILPIHIYCYTFSRADDRVEDIRIRLKTILPEINVDEISCRFVRQVAPNKDMMCVNIKLFDKQKKKDDKDITVKRFKQNSSE